MTTKNFVVKNGLTVGTVTIDATSGNLVAGNANLGNLALANFFSGNGYLLTGIVSSGGNANFANYAGNVTGSSQGNITSLGTLTSLGVSGTITAANITANSGVFTGNGSGLSSLTGANVSGAVPYATTANSVAGANVSGAVSFATTANAVAGANVSGAVSFATTANAVAGANVSGEVSFAATANAVAGANVSGQVGFANVANNVAGANVSGQVGNALVAGTVYGNAQANITSVGTLTSVEVSGNANVGTNLITNNILGRTTGVTITAAGTDQSITLAPTGTGTINASNARISSLATPTNDTDAATKAYVDSVASGLDPKASVVYATATTLPAYTYNNGTSGVGATLTGNANGALSIDGNTVSAAQRVLIKDETGANAPYNGIYVVTNAGSGAAAYVLTRSTDFDTGSEMVSAFTFVENGTYNADTGWVCITNAPITVGTTAIAFSQFSGAGTYTAGSGLTLTGSVFSVNTAQPTITSVGTLDSLSVTGNINCGNISATNGGFTTIGGNLTTNAQPNITSVGILTSVSVSGNANVGNIGAAAGVFTTVAGSLTTAAQGNITSTGTLTSLSVSGNANVGNLGTGIITASGNANVGNIGANNAIFTLVTGTLVTADQPNVTSIGTLSSLSITGNANVGNIGANNAVFTSVTGTLVTAAQPNVTSTGTLSSLSVSGNANIGNIGTGIITASGNANVGNIGANNAVFTLVTGTLVTAAQGNITSVGTLASLSVTGNANVGNIGTNIITATGNANVGNIGAAAGVFTTVAGSLTTAAQPNITSTGTLSSLSVTGNANVGNIGAGIITASGNANVGNIGANNAVFTLITGTLVTAAQGNITSVGTLASLSVTGNANVGNLGVIGGLTSTRSPISVVTNTVLDQFSPATYKTAKYVISATGDNGVQSVETLLAQDSTSSFITIYASICSNNTADIIELSSNINGVSGNVTLYATASGANTSVNIVTMYI
jgi:hypothetical protein